MNEITVRKVDLLVKIKTNRADHRQIFEEALDGFQRTVVAELQSSLQAILNGNRRDVRISHAVPVDHTRDYDRAIAMVEMAIADEITLTEADFAQYVMDDWGWQGQFLRSAYGSQTAVSKFADVYTVQ